MAKVNKHGLRMIGLRDACGETRFLARYPRHGAYVQIDCDKTTGRVYADFFIDQNSWTARRGDVVTVARALAPMTMQQIADKIAAHVRHI